MHRKDEHIERFVMAYIWNACSAEDAQIFRDDLDGCGEDSRTSGLDEHWVMYERAPRRSGTGANAPSKQLGAAIEPHMMGSGMWRTEVAAAFCDELRALLDDYGAEEVRRLATR